MPVGVHASGDTDGGLQGPLRAAAAAAAAAAVSLRRCTIAQWHNLRVRRSIDNRMQAPQSPLFDTDDCFVTATSAATASVILHIFFSFFQFPVTRFHISVFRPLEAWLTGGSRKFEKGLKTMYETEPRCQLSLIHIMNYV